MTQIATILTKTGAIQVEMPSADALVTNSIQWGMFDTFPTPAYWQFQVMARRITESRAEYRLGRTLVEEAAACLLGGHGIPAPIGIAAFKKLRELGAFSEGPHSREQFELWLREPLRIGQRFVHYRFAAQKAAFLAASLPRLISAPTFSVGRQLRDWLIQMPGIGPKTASWITRNWMDADDVAILDIHIMRIGQALGLFPQHLTVARNYFELEALFLQFSRALDVRTSELDAVIWYEMASSPTITRIVLDHMNKRSRGRSRAPKPYQSKQAQLTLA